MAAWRDKAKAKHDFEQRLPPQRGDVFVVNDVHTWKGQKTLCYLRTRDVGHSFFVPAMRVKQDAVPGMRGRLYLTATKSCRELQEPARIYKLDELRTLVPVPEAAQVCRNVPSVWNSQVFSVRPSVPK